MSARDELLRLQRWFAGIVSHPGTTVDALRSRRLAGLVVPRDLLEGNVVEAHPLLGTTGGLDIYNGGYLARLVEVMEGDYGCLRAVLGPEAFHRLVAGYVERHPSRHPNLNRLGADLPGYLRRRRKLAHRAFLAELAELERAVATAFDAPEFRPLAADALSRVPPERWSEVVFEANPSLHLLAFRHPVDTVYQAWKDGLPVEVPDLTPSWVAVFRRGDRVWRQRLVRQAHAVLAALLQGRPLAAALGLAKAGEPVGEWFQGFATDGLFTGIRVGSPGIGPAALPACARPSRR